MVAGALVLATALLVPAAAQAAPGRQPSPLPSVPIIEEEKSGDGVRAQEYWLDDYGFREAWKESTGKGVKVAVIDTGVDAGHPDLEGNVVKGSDASGGGSPDGWEGLGAEPEHGTLVASMIAAHGHSDPKVTAAPGSEPGKPAGMIGVAPEAQILPISLWIGTENPGGVSVEDQVPQAVRTAVDSGADVINLSVGSSKTSWPESWDAAFEYAQEKDVVLVASAGNRGSGVTQVGAPSTIPGVISVGGVDRQRVQSEESSAQGISIAVAAPSEDLIGAMPGDGYGLWSGTSASAPLVSGLVALMRERHPDDSAAQIVQRLITTAQDRGAAGRDPQYGYGVIDPVAALDQDVDVDSVTENPLGSVEKWASIHRRAVPSEEARQAEETPEPTPEHEEGESIAAVAPPEPAAPETSLPRLLPIALIGAFGLWVGVLAVGAVVKIRRAARLAHDSE
ncbi:S8 family serine peptidase [Rothia sp. AR01]|uniref:S8 family serine peptidase n=1 Tax=Rothia santali TaxID=2949643 RepID=A0A9X2HEU6_9MICC|nr:S8 family serine peptidase [Rothia santali]MCP3426800.1 S8 family serine peptidase [Rothia santali]